MLRRDCVYETAVCMKQVRDVCSNVKAEQGGFEPLIVRQ